MPAPPPWLPYLSHNASVSYQYQGDSTKVATRQYLDIIDIITMHYGIHIQTSMTFGYNLCMYLAVVIGMPKSCPQIIPTGKKIAFIMWSSSLLPI